MKRGLAKFRDLLIIILLCLSSSVYASSAKRISESTRIDGIEERLNNAEQQARAGSETMAQFSKTLEKNREYILDFEQRINKNVSFDSKIANAAYIIAATFASLPVFIALFGFVEWRSYKKLESKVVKFEEDIGERMQKEFDKYRDIMIERVKNTVTKEMRDEYKSESLALIQRYVTEIEANYATSMAKLEGVLLSFIENEIGVYEKEEGGVLRGVSAFVVYRSLLTRVLSGDIRSSTAALGRIRCEYVERLGPISRFMLVKFIKDVAENQFYARSEFSDIVEKIEKLAEEGNHI